MLIFLGFWDVSAFPTTSLYCKSFKHSKASVLVAKCRCKIEFWPHWISTRGVLIQRATIKIQQIFHVELRPPETGGHCITTPPTDKILTPPPPLLNCDPT